MSEPLTARHVGEGYRKISMDLFFSLPWKPFPANPMLTPGGPALFPDGTYPIFGITVKKGVNAVVSGA